MAWCAIVALALYYVWHNAGRYLDARPEVYGYFWPKRLWLWLHIGGAVFTLLLGPLQFVGRLRAAYPRAHRWSGRVYIVGLLAAAIGAAGMSATTPLGWTTGVAFMAMVTAWLATAAIAWIAIRMREIAVHREWMLRNYIITFAFVTFRLMTKVPGAVELGTVAEVFTTFVWTSWVVPLLGYEIVLAARRLRGRQAASRPANPRNSFE